MALAALSRVEVGGHSIGYRQAGDGPPLVLLHGFLCDSRCWRTQLEDLSDTFCVVAWDAPGAGASPDPPDSFTVTDWAHCFAEFLDVMGIGTAQLVGLSWGGILAQEFYRLYPARVLGFVFADTYAGWRGSFSESVAQKRMERCRRESFLPPEAFVPLWAPKEFFSAAASSERADEMAAVVADFHPLGFRLMAQALADTDSTGLLPKIDVPTLLLWGDSDARSPVDVVGAQFRDAIPGAELVVIKNAGHLSNMERPEEFNAQVRRFCSPSPAMA
jgi:pimeloyl-ACP methyl ester carboxylesterase